MALFSLMILNKKKTLSIVSLLKLWLSSSIKL